MEDKYTTDELKFFDEKVDELMAWLFDTDNKRYAILHTFKEVYNKGKENPTKHNNQKIQSAFDRLEGSIKTDKSVKEIMKEVRSNKAD